VVCKEGRQDLRAILVQRSKATCFYCEDKRRNGGKARHRWQVDVGEERAWSKRIAVSSWAISPVTATATPPPIPRLTPSPAVTRDSSAGGKELLKVYPSYFRNHPIKFCALVLFAIVGCVTLLAGFFISKNFDRYYVASFAGVILAGGCGLTFLRQWLRYRSIALIVTDKRTTLRFGLLSRYVKEVRHRDVRMLIVSQGFLQQQSKSRSSVPAKSERVSCHNL
jgi:hypothetical protein